jgi:hypothetical protein
MKILRRQLDALIAELEAETQLRERLANLVSVYPFNEFEYIIATLLGMDKLTLDQYHELRDEYISRNLYLYIFEISAPRTFGEAWAQGHLKELVPESDKPTKKLDPDYSGQYDFRLDDKIRVEVKASRAVDLNSAEPLYVKALSSDSERSFDMNFQQTKPSCCDVFVWIGVWRDRIRYWVLASNEVACSKHFSDKQHRGNVGEGQLHLTRENIAEFAPYETTPRSLLQAIRDSYSRQLAASLPRKEEH